MKNKQEEDPEIVKTIRVSEKKFKEMGGPDVHSPKWPKGNKRGFEFDGLRKVAAPWGYGVTLLFTKPTWLPTWEGK